MAAGNSEGAFAPLPKPPPRNRCAGKAGARTSIASRALFSDMSVTWARLVARIGERLARERRDAEDGRRLLRVEPDRVGGPAPELPLVRDELVHLQPILGCHPQLPHRQVQARLVRLERVQVDRHPHGVLAVRAPLAVEEDVVVVALVEFQVPALLEGGVLAADPVDPGDVRLDVTGRLPVPRPDLVLL